MTLRRRSSFLASGLAALVASVALAVWDLALEGASPTSGVPSVEGERFTWIGPGVGPIGIDGDLQRSDVIAVGDSRLGYALHGSLAPSLDLGRFALIWGSGAKTIDALRPLGPIPPRSLVVSLSPLGLVGHQDARFSRLLRERHPAFDPLAPPRVVRAWSLREVQNLVAEGVPEPAARGAVEWWVDHHRMARDAHTRAARLVDTEGIDRRLAHHLDRWRVLHVQPVEPAEWHTAWLAPARLHENDDLYRGATAPERAVERASAALELAVTLRALRAAGWRVACVRWPIEPGLRQIEDASGTGALLLGITDEVGLPYLDLGAWADSTYDGSHLHWRGGDRATRALGRWLRDDLGWERVVRPR